MNIKISARPFEAERDPLAAAAADIARRYPSLSGWDLKPHWDVQDRDRIIVTVPSWFLSP
jgi:hypothetical protein